MKNELIMLNIGQCGVQMGQAFWEQIIYEHSIQPDGSFNKINTNEIDDQISLFKITKDNQYVPRTLFIDSEPTIIDEIKNGDYRDLYSPSSYHSGLQDAANNFARGRYTVVKAMIDHIENSIRKEVEESDDCQGFISLHSTNGGTGSGLAVRILQYLCEDYSKFNIIQAPIFPSDCISSAVVVPYNAVLHCGFGQPFTNLVMMMDNQAMMNLFIKHLSISKPNNTSVNRLVAQILSSLVCGLHYDASPSMNNFDELTTNLVPFPDMHYTFLRHAPIIGENNASYQSYFNPTLSLTKTLLSQNHPTLTADAGNTGALLSCYITCRGKSIGCQRVITDELFQIKSKGLLNLVDWCPTGFKVIMHNVPALKSIPKSGIAEFPMNATMVVNGTKTTIREFDGIINKFDQLFKKRSFVHWYVGEGMEEGEFQEANNAIKEINATYKLCV